MYIFQQAPLSIFLVRIRIHRLWDGGSKSRIFEAHAECDRSRIFDVHAESDRSEALNLVLIQIKTRLGALIWS